MSNKSRNIELAVSIPPAPFPIIVCVPECSDVNAIALSVPLTQRGSSLGTSLGDTFNSLLHDAISFIAQLLFAAFYRQKSVLGNLEPVSKSKKSAKKDQLSLYPTPHTGTT